MGWGEINPRQQQGSGTLATALTTLLVLFGVYTLRSGMSLWVLVVGIME